MRLADRQLEAIAAHQLDEHLELQLAASLDLVGVGPVGVQDPQGDVAHQLLVEARADLAGGQLVAIEARQGGGVDADGDRHRGLVHCDHRQRPRVADVGQRLADRDFGDARDGDDFARTGLGRVHPVERIGDVQLGDLGSLDGPVRPAPCDLLALADRAVAHAADGQPPDVGGGVEVRNERLQGMVALVGRRGDAVEQQVEQRREVAGVEAIARRVGERGGTGLRVAVDDRELDLVLLGVEVEEQLVDLVDDLGDARVGAVDLVDHEDHRQARLESLSQYEAGLRQWPLGGVDEQQHPVDHCQTALDLAAEVGVAGRVDDVELHAPVAQRGVLGEDRDALLALQVHRVQHAGRDVLPLAERPGLPQHRVDKGRLAVVDVGDDRHVPDVISCAEHGSTG